jgi:stringent starvation protein B
MTDITTQPLKPYLVRAFYDWLTDSFLTPHLLVDATKPGVVVPVDLVKDGRIVLNIRFQAVENLSIGPELIMFSTRFSGTHTDIVVPYDAVLGIYAKETGGGMMFDVVDPIIAESAMDIPAAGSTMESPLPDIPTVRRSHLTVVK